MLKRKKEDGVHDLNVATIFSYSANEEDQEAGGIPTLDDANQNGQERLQHKHSRDKLEDFIQD